MDKYEMSAVMFVIAAILTVALYNMYNDHSCREKAIAANMKAEDIQKVCR